MADLLIDEIDDQFLANLALRAQRNKVSIDLEALNILREALVSPVSENEITDRQ